MIQGWILLLETTIYALISFPQYDRTTLTKPKQKSVLEQHQLRLLFIQPNTPAATHTQPQIRTKDGLLKGYTGALFRPDFGWGVHGCPSMSFRRRRGGLGRRWLQDTHLDLVADLLGSLLTSESDFLEAGALGPYKDSCLDAKGGT